MASKTSSSNKQLDESALEQAVECLRTLAHPHRIRIVEMLLDRPHTVGELAEGCGIASHVTSTHLRIMKDRRLLAAQRDGRFIHYSIAEAGLGAIIDCIRSRYGCAPGVGGKRSSSRTSRRQRGD